MICTHRRATGDKTLMPFIQHNRLNGFDNGDILIVAHQSRSGHIFWGQYWFLKCAKFIEHGGWSFVLLVNCFGYACVSVYVELKTQCQWFRTMCVKSSYEYAHFIWIYSCLWVKRSNAQTRVEITKEIRVNNFSVHTHNFAIAAPYTALYLKWKKKNESTWDNHEARSKRL